MDRPITILFIDDGPVILDARGPGGTTSTSVGTGGMRTTGSGGGAGGGFGGSGPGGFGGACEEDGGAP
jgi:hypothetical protein